MRLEFSRQIFGKYQLSSLYQNPSSGSRVVCSIRTHGHDEANGHFANAPKNDSMVK